MNARRFFVVLTIVCLPVVASAALPAPTNLSVTVGADALDLDWDDVAGAAKYSVDIEGTVTYVDAVLGELTADVEVSFGTSDRTDGGDMADSDLTITLEELAAAIAAELGVDPSALVSLEGSAKVKALDPGKNKGSQNNPFSDPPVDFSVAF